MTTVIEIERAIKKLPRDDYGRLRQWLEDDEVENELAAASAQIARLLDEEDGEESQLLEE